MITTGTHIFTTVLQNNLDTISTCEVLIGSIIALLSLNEGITQYPRSGVED